MQQISTFFRHVLACLPCGSRLLLALLFVARAVTAAEFDAEKLTKVREVMQKYVDNQTLAGAITVIGTSRGVAALDTVGKATLEASESLPKNTLFRIASMTKPITAIAVMQLVDQGKLSTDDLVEKYLPEFKGQMQIESKSGDTVTLKKPARPITIRDLLTHTSGLSAFPPGLADIYSKRDRTLAEMTLAVSQRPLEFAPGSKWAYCNPGIDTLGRIIEVVSGEPYARYMSKHIFEPLGMIDTTFFPSAAQLKRSAGLYKITDGKLESAGFTLIGNPENVKHPIPAGGLYSTGADLAKLYQVLLKNGALTGGRLLSAESLAAMTKTQTGDIVTGFTPGMSYGFGFAVVKEPQGVTEKLSPGTYGHGGAFGTQGWLDPQRDLFIVLLIQRVGLPNSDGSDIRRDLQHAVYNAIK